MKRLKKYERYVYFVRHPNYNPRIVEYVTKPRVYKSVPADKYFDYIKKKFDKPEDVWKDEYRNRLNEEDRVLLNTLYSVTDNTIGQEVLEKAYHGRTSAEAFPTTMNAYEESCSRLTNSLLKNVMERGRIGIGAINPSVNDFLKMHLTANAPEQIKIIKNAVYVEQILKVSRTQEADDVCRNMLRDGTFLEKSVLKNSVEYYYLQLLCRYKMFEEELKPIVQRCFAHMADNIGFIEESNYGDWLLELINSGYMEYYELYPVMKEESIFEKILEPLPYAKLVRVLRTLEKEKIFSDDEMKLLEPIMREKLKQRICEDASANIDNDSMDILVDLVDECEEDMSEYEEVLFIGSQCETAKQRLKVELETEIARHLWEGCAVGGISRTGRGDRISNRRNIENDTCAEAEL